jgi:hypothetical protein
MTLTTRTLTPALAEGGALLDAYDAVWDALWTQPYIPAEALELCRLRLAQLHGAKAETALRVVPAIPEEQIRLVLAGRYEGSADFSSLERAVLELAEVYAQDPSAITDAMADEIKRHVGEPGLVCLVEALGFIDGRIRLALMFSAIEAAGAQDHV